MPRRGEQHHKAVLTAAKVEAIYLDPRKQRVIAADHGVSESTVGRIKQGKIWKETTAHLRGRMPTYPPGCRMGEDNGTATLTVEKVQAIFLDPRPQHVIAKEHGINPSQVSKIKNRWLWVAATAHLVG